MEREARSVTITRLDCSPSSRPVRPWPFPAAKAPTCVRWWKISASPGLARTSRHCGGPRPGRSPLAQAITLETLERVHAEGGPDAGPIPDAGRQRPVALAGVAVVRAQCVLLAARAAGAGPGSAEVRLLGAGSHGRFIGIGEVTDDGRIARVD